MMKLVNGMMSMEINGRLYKVWSVLKWHHPGKYDKKVLK